MMSFIKMPRCPNRLAACSVISMFSGEQILWSSWIFSLIYSIPFLSQANVFVQAFLLPFSEALDSATALASSSSSRRYSSTSALISSGVSAAAFLVARFMRWHDF